jgi:hypothetical protein
MAAKTDPGSYTVQDDPFDTFSATLVPLHTPLGPVTLHFMSDDQVFVDSGYQVADYRSAEGAFTWKGAEVVGAQTLWQDQGWMPRPEQQYGRPHFTSRSNRNITALMTEGILAYWSEIVRRYVAEHPLIPAHARLRRAVKTLADQEKAIHEAEQQLAEMRKARARDKRQVYSAFIEVHTVSEPGITCWPVPYRHETLNGYVLELENDVRLSQNLAELRQTRQASS